MKNSVVIIIAAILIIGALIFGWLYWPQKPLKARSIFGDETPPKKSCYLKSKEENAVFEAIIPYLYKRALSNMGRSDESVPFVVILGFTNEEYENRFPLRISNNVGLKEVIAEEKLSGQIVDDYKRRNKETLILKDNLNVAIKYRLMSQNKYKEIFLSSFLQADRLFFEKYPNSIGFISFSRPGIYSDKAFIYGQIWSGYMASLDMFLILGKEKDHWKILKEIPLSVS